ncbi:MAG TPA: hypothetical protein VMW08_10070 [Acidimicrobiales bacterium]|nr:hypothetical protein [Acidimicrobiales bacterium]
MLRRTISAVLALALGLSALTFATATPAAAEFSNQLGAGDFDGDGKADLFFSGSGTTGDGVFYDVNGAFDFRPLFTTSTWVLG